MRKPLNLFLKFAHLPSILHPVSLVAYIKQNLNLAHSICMLTSRFNFQQRPVGGLPFSVVLCVCVCVCVCSGLEPEEEGRDRGRRRRIVQSNNLGARSKPSKVHRPFSKFGPLPRPVRSLHWKVQRSDDSPFEISQWTGVSAAWLRGIIARWQRKP